MGNIKKIGIGLLLAGLTACQTISPPILDFSTIRKATKPVLVSTDGKTANGNGTGVVLAPGYMLTAMHVVDGQGDKLVVGTSIEKGLPAIVIKGGNAETRDLALLHVPGLQCPCVTVVDKLPAVDTPIYHVGYPMYNVTGVQFLTQGHIQELFVRDEVELLMTTTNLAPGSSGGGIFVESKQGNLQLASIAIKILHGRQQSPFAPPQMLTWMSISVPTHIIREFLVGTPVEQK